ncbi:Aspartyl protease family protein [Actinidia chinensis var. chinensis]|uniref:Aspartyl protease family protein n=1 Tax=Actinidia chinensis var. chinensis TaxID=1590841 RepID=A0A2R6QG03_ACTCC|nr:Aspartyl protease family protein [Actinidia chinensis var. chinensis]
MVGSTLLLPLILSTFLIHHLSVAKVSIHREKTVLSLNKFQRKQHSGIPNCSSQKSRRENGATILEMKHRDYCSRPVVDWNEMLQKRLISDEIQVRSFQSRIKYAVYSGMEDLSNSQIPLTLGSKLQTLNYIVTVELGGLNVTVIVDTGSDLTWVQCQPCKLCYNQRNRLFNPLKSPSYKSVSCDSPTCQSLQFATGNSGICSGNSPPICNYFISYGDGSYTHGDLSSDRLHLGTARVDNFVFGCGRNNRGLFGKASGLMGLGRSDLSLVSQTNTLFGGVFSYCLPSTDDSASGSLILGDNSSVYKNSSPISYTRMIPNPQLSNFYLANLTGISIGGVELQGPGFGNSGNEILVDSGTVITRLSPSVYRALKDEFVKQFSGFPSVHGFSILDTCFNLSGYKEVNIPTMTLHFEGDAELNVDVTGIFYFVKTDASQVCLAIASLSYEDEIAIIGNYQQRNIRVVYDTKASKLGFAKETCSFM